ncbi:MAG: NAD(P)/FAD-dependent oxidoreductase [Paracoccaceae bacterium]
MEKVIIVGGGQAAASLAHKMRSLGFDGALTMMCEEKTPPYQRPPLSKKYLLGEMALERLYLRPEHYYVEQNITLHLGERVNALDRQNNEIITEKGQYAYDRLVLATGSTPRLLPAHLGGTLENVFSVRDLKDADSLAPHMKEGKRLLIIGGGYIGLEAAAVAAARGMDVTLIEMSERILQRVAAPQTSDYFRSLHQSHGVTIKEQTGLTRLLGQNGQVVGAELSDGSTLEIDLAILGIGITPATNLAQDCGLAIENGIRVDALGRSSDPNIWAAGDCCSFPYKDGYLRLESVPNAIDQAEVIAQNIMGAEIAYIPKPWFWSDQYDVKLQIAGLNTGYDKIIERKNPTLLSQSFWYYAQDTLIAVDAMNDPRAYMVAKKLIESGLTPDPALVEDASSNLKDLLKQ